jgi:hypothetical protein
VFKLNHDFLPPNYPIPNRAYVTIARHKIGMLDFEVGSFFRSKIRPKHKQQACQRDILEVLDNRVWGLCYKTLLVDLRDVIPALNTVFSNETKEWRALKYEVNTRIRIAVMGKIHSQCGVLAHNDGSRTRDDAVLALSAGRSRHPAIDDRNI